MAHLYGALRQAAGGFGRGWGGARARGRAPRSWRQPESWAPPASADTGGRSVLKASCRFHPSGSLQAQLRPRRSLLDVWVWVEVRQGAQIRAALPSNHAQRQARGKANRFGPAAVMSDAQERRYPQMVTPQTACDHRDHRRLLGWRLAQQPVKMPA